MWGSNVYTLSSSCLSCTLHIHCSSTGVLCQSFSPPTGEICPGDDVTFTCSAGAATFWIVGPRDEDECAYRSGNPTTQMCGPGDRFTSGPTDGDITSSSLRVDSITADLNGTLVNCTNADGNLIGSGSIFIVGTIINLMTASIYSFRLIITVTVPCSLYYNYNGSIGAQRASLTSVPHFLHLSITT